MSFYLLVCLGPWSGSVYLQQSAWGHPDHAQQWGHPLYCLWWLWGGFHSLTMAVIHAQGEPFPPLLPQLNVFDISYWIIFNEVFLWNLYISFSWSCLLPSTFRMPLDLTKPRYFLATDMFMAYICSHPQILRLPHPYEFPSFSSHFCSRSLLLKEQGHSGHNAPLCVRLLNENWELCMFLDT